MNSTYCAVIKHKTSLDQFDFARQFLIMGIGDRIAEARKLKGWSQGTLGQEVGAVQTTVSSWERGRTEPTREDVQRIAQALGVSLADLELSGRRSRPALLTVPLVGYVGAGSEAHFYNSGDDGLGEVDAPPGASAQTRAAEIRGESLGPLFEHWLVFYDDVRTPVTSDLIGRLCIVGLPSGKVLVKKLQRSRTPDLFHLLSNSEAPMLDQEVAWAARVTTMTPR